MSELITYFSKRGFTILDAALIFIIGWYGTKLILYIIVKMMKRSNIDSIVISFVKPIISIGLRIVVLITAISALGVNTGSFVTILATAGAALVLGLKDSMSGIVSGMTILFAKPFVKGDTIEVNNYIGKIEEIQLLYTILMTFDNKMVVIPNNELASSTFVNYSHEDIRRVEMEFNIHYESDVELAKQLIRDVIEEHPYAKTEPLPYVRVSQYKEHAITIGIRVWAQTEYYYDLRDDLLEQIKLVFDKNGIRIPYPQMEVHISSKERGQDDNI